MNIEIKKDCFLNNFTDDDIYSMALYTWLYSKSGETHGTNTPLCDKSSDKKQYVRKTKHGTFEFSVEFVEDKFVKINAIATYPNSGSDDVDGYVIKVTKDAVTIKTDHRRPTTYPSKLSSFTQDFYELTTSGTYSTSHNTSKQINPLTTSENVGIQEDGFKFLQEKMGAQYNEMVKDLKHIFYCTSGANPTEAKTLITTYKY